MTGRRRRRRRDRSDRIYRDAAGRTGAADDRDLPLLLFFTDRAVVIVVVVAQC